MFFDYNIFIPFNENKGHFMPTSHIVNRNLPFFAVPSELEDIYPITEIEKTKGSEEALEVLKSLKSINEVILYDEENDMPEIIDNGYTDQVINYSLKHITKATIEKPEYVNQVVDTFQIEAFFLNIKADIKKLQDEILTETVQ